MSGIGDVCDRFRPERRRARRLPGAVDARPAGRQGHRLSDDDRLRRLAILNLMCNLEPPTR
ncbi:MAG: hypothetical protein IPM94_14015 [bacterium]|nr:hypothetical protein [bacterium]